MSELEKDLELLRLAQKVVKEAEENAKKHPTGGQIQIVIVEPLKRPYKATISNKLEEMQKIVNGYIENVFIGEFDGLKIALVLNEEGKLKGLPLNRRIVGFVNPIVGTFFISAYNKKGDAVNLSDDLAETYIKRFAPLEVYL
jgi:hypothetical protein